MLLLSSCGDLQGRGDGAPSERGFPPRPSDLAIANVDPCESLDDKQIAELDVTAPRPNASTPGAPACDFLAADLRFWGIRVTSGVPANAYLPGDPGYQGDQLGYVGPRMTTVDGFGAVEFVNGVTASSSDCVLAVDAAPNVTLLIDYLDTSSRATLDRSVGSRAEGCAQASRVAAMVIETARARVGA
ncbi:DUF3558 family protein [Pseudonocardia sp. KRD291]|uniref:DUF3558 family protein n=1 Tax=Pseudonocardia sp. KRD291 TaxID=2792007 RepID=UPI001C49CB92|nr:DUF3558 family protein [Pseudonocardia sp. KRD291]MBW0101388.1 DUF3558 family protein [Pseudonocardia sp. KRD291]